MTVTTEDARPSGASIKERVVGGGAPSHGDPFLAPFFETATEHVWGGVWNRPGLELKYRSLVVVSVLAATGHANAELKTHLRGALNLGWTIDELREALLQIGGYAGFPASHEALDALSELVAEAEIEGSLPVSGGSRGTSTPINFRRSHDR